MSNSHYPSLFLLLNVHEAHWYKVSENGVESLHSYDDKKDTYEDHEGGFGRGAAEPDVLNARREEETHHNLREIAEKTAAIWKDGSFEHLTCALPDQHKNLMREELERALPQVEVKWLYGDYTSAGKEEVLNRFKESLKVV